MSHQLVLIYSEFKSNRLKFVLDFIFKDIAGLDYRVTQSQEEAKQHPGILINYSGKKENLSDGFFIPSVVFLNDKNVDKDLSLQPGKDKASNLPVIFEHPVPPLDNGLSFDLFSACFYLLSRYEEYLPYIADKHGRFLSKSSFVEKYGLVEKPIVDKWIFLFLSNLKKKYPYIKLKEKQLYFLPTFDIDQVRIFEWKSFIRKTGSLLRDLSNGRLKSILHKFKIQIGKAKDPYDCFNEIDNLCSTYSFKPLFFYLLADYSKYDKNIKHSHKKFVEHIRLQSQKHKCGIHPSYYASENKRLLLKEHKRLEYICGKPATDSRQHYLRLKIPESCRLLESVGILNDYSLGFPDRPGFKAGTAHPFLFYDLEKDEIGNLRFFPLSIMDVSMKNYMKLSPEEAIDMICNIMDNCKETGGIISFLWHNESFNWKEWKDVPNDVFAYAASINAKSL